jgi:hypothetical protein
MPLLSGKKARTKAGFSENIRREMESGNKPQKQAIAIAYSQARGKKRRGNEHFQHYQRIPRNHEGLGDDQ